MVQGVFFEEMSEQVLYRWVKDRVLKRWGVMWLSFESGAWKRQFLNDVGKSHPQFSGRFSTFPYLIGAMAKENEKRIEKSHIAMTERLRNRLRDCM